MINNKRVVVVLPAYNAEMTLKKTIEEISDVVDACILVDDRSTDGTVALANKLGLQIHVHERNRGYGGNQKTCYAAALNAGADIVVMLHPDYQYSPLLVEPMASMIAYGLYDMVLGSRILGGGALRGGMPLHKYVANRALTLLENLALGAKLSEYHTGFRAYSRELLLSLPLSANSEDFVFDNQVLAQCIYLHARIGEVSCPTRYFPEASSINLRRSVVYGMGVLQTTADCVAARLGIYRKAIFDFPPLQLKRQDMPVSQALKEVQ
jgi:glycosyltransferase involved in cell wall biosynthesis